MNSLSLSNPFFYVLISNIVAFIICFGMAFFFKKYYYEAQAQSSAVWKCQADKNVSAKAVHRDLKLSCFNLILLSTLSGMFIYYFVLTGYSGVYFDLSQHGVMFSIFSAIFYILWIDFFLYWAHRIFHQPFLFRKIHRIHHRTTAPIAINAFSMHPLEGVSYHIITIAPLVIFPVHYIGAMVVVLYTYYVSLIDHSGVKFYSWFFWQSPSQFHDDHHKYFHVNYGQTCWFWDRMFGSFRKNKKIYGAEKFETKKSFKLFASGTDNVHYNKNDSFFVKHRVAIIVLFCLPASYIFTFFSRQFRRIKALLNQDKQHDVSCQIVQEDCRFWQQLPKELQKPLCTNRKNWMSLSTRFFDKKKCSTIRTQHLTNILSIDYQHLTVRAEPMVTVGQMIDYLTPVLYTLAVSLEIREATLGGLAMGVGMTTHSHRVGLFQESIVAYEIVLPTGELLRVTEHENSDLFRALPWSHGTLGFIVALELKIIPIKKFVRVLYTPVFSEEEYCQKIRDLAVQENAADFLEATIYSKNEAVIMQGWFDDGTSATAPAINKINKFYSPWYFKHVESFLKKGESSELIYFKDYIFRHNRAIFWTLQDMIPNGNHPWMRLFLGWMYPPNIAFLKLTTPKKIRKFTFSKQVFQDIVLPMTSLAAAIDLSDKLFSIYPLLVYPCRIYDHGEEAGQLRSPREIDRVNGKNYGMYCDLGIYGVPKAVKENTPYNATASMQAMEKFIRAEGGYSFLYADTFMTQDEFAEMFDLSLYEKIRVKYNIQSVFPHLFEKTRSEIDVISLGNE